ncbi:MAG: phosphoesterase, partial [Opitutae bacterium]|nr:phosphoesterase [Opitutae bacterium]
MLRRISRRSFLTGLVAAPALVGFYAWRVEPVWLELVRRDLPVRNLPAALDGKTLAHLSDIHI